MFGTLGGVTTDGAQVYDQAGPTPGTPEPGDLFGRALAFGDLYVDGKPGLIIGAPGEDTGTTQDVGLVTLIANT